MSKIRTKKENKVLLVCYYFPPIGGTGIIRNLKYCKYLPQLGWKPTVLTVKDVSYYIYDEAALNELPASCRVERAGSLDPLRISYLLRQMFAFLRRDKPAEKKHANTGAIKESSALVTWYRNARNWLFFPDGQAGWIPFAVWRGCRVVKKEGIDVVMGSAHPISSVVIAALIAKITNKPLVLDFRDGWVGDPYIIMPTRLHNHLHKLLERWVLQSANSILCYGTPFQLQYMQRYSALANRIHIIPNGFDPEDFSHSFSPSFELGERKTYQLIWTGALVKDLYRQPFIKVLQACDRLPKELIARICITIVGRSYAGASEDVARICPELSINFAGQVTHQEANQKLSQADAALMLLPAGNNTFISNKVYEYLGAGLPILAVVEPSGVCADILCETGRADYICAPDDVEAIAGAIKKMIEAGFPRPPIEAAQKYSRKHTARQLAQHLQSAMETGRSGLAG